MSRKHPTLEEVELKHKHLMAERAKGRPQPLIEDILVSRQHRHQVSPVKCTQKNCVFRNATAEELAEMVVGKKIDLNQVPKSN